MHGRSTDTSLAEIRYEMSKLFDNQVNAQKERNFRAHASPRKKCAMKMKEEKNDGRLKYF